MPERSDSLATRLAALAPEVDMTASRALFDDARANARPGVRRWLLSAAVISLLAAGVVGLWAVARDDVAEAPATPIDDTDVDVSFEMIGVEATQLPFGTIRAATTRGDFEELWGELDTTTERPSVDFEGRFVVGFTLPDDACPDLLERFLDQSSDGAVVRQPVFVPPPGGCNEPLITRTYVVAIDRPTVTTDITFVLPRDDVYDYGPSELTISVAAATATDVPGPDRPEEPDMVTTDTRVPLPPVGSPRLEAGIFGIAWIVQHDDGTVSVLDAVVDRAADEDEGGISGLATLVMPADDGSAFAATYIWDAHGRTVNGPRSNDLGGFVGVVDGDEVEIFVTPTNRVDGEPDDVTETTFGTDAAEALAPMDLDVLPTLSYRGPIWRLLDATLVVEGGVGTICDVEPASVDRLATCVDGLATTITSSRPEITSWFLSPILVEFGDLGEIVMVAPVGGSASRNDGPDGAATPVSGDGWRLLPTATVDEQSAPRVIVDDRQAGAPDVDYERSVVLVIDIAGNECEPELLDVLIDPDRVRPIFGSGGSECGESLGIYRFLIEIDRALLGPLVVVEAPETIGGPTTRTELPVVGSLVDPTPVPRSETLSITIPTCPGRNPTEVVVILLSSRDADVDVVIAAGGTSVGTSRASLAAGASTEVTVPVTNASLGVDVVIVREQNGDEIIAAQPIDSCG